MFLFFLLFLRSLLSIDAADSIGLMPGKVNYYVEELTVSQIPLSMKLSGNLVMSHWKTGLRMLSNNIICLLYQTGATIGNLTRVKMVDMQSNKLPPTKISLLQSVKISRYQIIK